MPSRQDVPLVRQEISDFMMIPNAAGSKDVPNRRSEHSSHSPLPADHVT
jgi:hypothetical protein